MISSLYACKQCHAFCKALQSTIYCTKLNCLMRSHCIAAAYIATCLTPVPHGSYYTYVFIRISSIFVFLATFIPSGDLLHNG
jgi:hypothetical protein